MASETMDKSTLEGKVASELHTIAAGLGIEGHQRLKKADLIDRIIAHTNGEGDPGEHLAAAETVAVAETPAPAVETVVSGDGEVESPQAAVRQAERERGGAEPGRTPRAVRGRTAASVTRGAPTAAGGAPPARDGDA